MSKSDTFENDIVKLIFLASAIANIADNAASAPLTNLWVSLHTADPGEAGTQATSETAYQGYGRTAVARGAAGWTVTNNSVSPVATVAFPACTSTPATTTMAFAAVGISSTGATKYLYSGAISPVIVVTNGTTPQILPTSTITED
jgi:hypothetical protein